jgi:dynein regulatory complex protein 1
MSFTTGAAAAAAGQLGGQVVVSRRAREKEREFWERLAGAVDDKTLRVWCRLEKQLGKYHGLLRQRADGLAEIAALQQQNDELRMLLNQYLSSKINSELKIPPAAVL